MMRKLLRKMKLNGTLFKQLLFTALAFALMVVLSYIFMSIIVRGNLNRVANSVLGSAEGSVEGSVFEARDSLDGFSDAVRNMVMSGDSLEDIEKYVSEISGFSYLGSKQLSIGRGFGVYLETTPEGPVFLKSDSWLAPEGYKAGESDWYKAALSSIGDITETTPYINNRGETRLTYTKCLIDDNGERLGVACLSVQVDPLSDDIVSTALNQGGYGMLLNQDLIMLAHPNPDFIGRHLDDPVIPVKIFTDALSNGLPVRERPVISYKGEDSVAFFIELSNGWFLGMVTPESQFYRSITNMAIALALLGITLATVLIIILIRIDSERVKSNEESRQKSMFLANMSHEIRTPINAIVGMTAIGRAADEFTRKDYCFAKIDDASKHLLGVINNILDISKIEANKIELSPTEFNFEKLLQRTVNVVNFRIDEKQQQMRVHIDPTIPKFLIADDLRLSQVITNLLGNAIKFTPQNGLIGLKTSLISETPDGVCTIQFDISDTGIGIAPEQHGMMFHSFQQAESSTTRKFGGTGLGLSISKSIAELMGGAIWFESELGKGSTFSFTIKAKHGDDSKALNTYQHINWSNIRILAVDDDQSILDYFQDIVSRFGSSCEVALNANAAMQLVEQNGEYNIYFVDLKMPGIDGISLTKSIRAKEKNKGTSVVIMITSADLTEIEGTAKKAGVDRFLLKPIFPSSIADVISDCIGMVNEKADEIPINIDGIFKGYHVLFVEDLEINREIVLTLLESTMLDIDCAENGLEAVKMFSDAPEKYDLIFMDVQMPEMDGYEATKAIRVLDLPNSKTVPIIAMTANVFKEDVDNCLAAGMNGHLGKPLNMNDLLEEVLKYLDKKSADFKK